MKHEVVAALILQSGKVLLGQRAATRAYFPGVWDMFGGHLEAGEQPAETLVRELQEEWGITPLQWQYLETLELTDETSDHWIFHLYLVTGWEGAPTNRQVEEHSTIGWFSLSQALELDLADAIYPALFTKYLSGRWGSIGKS